MKNLPPIHINNANHVMLTPTDVTQFVRLQQCPRFLRLAMHERVPNHQKIWDDGSTKPQEVPPLLRLSGEDFESAMESAIVEEAAENAALSTHSFAPENKTRRTTKDNSNDNGATLKAARDLKNGACLTLFQPRLQAKVGAWILRGDLDLLHFRRDENGALRVLIADMKSSRAPRVEHRLQIAFYREMLEELLRENSIEYSEVNLGIIYRGSANLDSLDEKDRETYQKELQNARDFFGRDDAPLHLLPSAELEEYRESVRALALGENSRARHIAAMDFGDVPFHLDRKCGDCRYQEFCMKDAALRDDLSLVPHLAEQEKNALLACGVKTVKQLAALKTLHRETDPDEEDSAALAQPTSTQEKSKKHANELITPPEHKELVQKIAATWPVGPRLDELIHRARRYRRWKGDDYRVINNLPHKGHGSLPYSSAEHNPNLVRVYIDAQYDYLNERIYMLGARIAACGNGAVVHHDNVVCFADAPLQDDAVEAALLKEWIDQLLMAIYNAAQPDDNGEKSAPIHLIFWNAAEQSRLLEALGRHAQNVLAATPLYDFLTQLPAFDSPNFSFLDAELRTLKNYPIIAQTLQAISDRLRFDWKGENGGINFYEKFGTGYFDAWGKLHESEVPAGDSGGWITKVARFNSDFPLEYAYAAWDALPEYSEKKDPFKPYRGTTREDLIAFHEKRLEAMEFVAHKAFEGNKYTEKAAFHLGDLPNFQSQATSFAAALAEFTLIERHAELLAWKSARQLPPERRVLAGDSLVVQYREDDQDEKTRAINRENLKRRALAEEIAATLGEGETFSKEQKDATKQIYEGVPFRLRVTCDDADCSVEKAIERNTLNAGESIVLYERYTQDTRKSEDERVWFTPTPRQMLRGMRATLQAIERDDNGDYFILIEPLGFRQAAKNSPSGFIFRNRERPFEDGALLTIDSSPDDWYGSFCATAVAELNDGARNTLYEILCPAFSEKGDNCDFTSQLAEYSEVGQKRFLAGLEALAKIDPSYDFEVGKKEYIGGHANTRALLVQGPPGTGKSYATAFAILSRLQNAMAQNKTLRVFCGCKTHAATNVLLEAVHDVREKLRGVQQNHPGHFAQYFDARLFEVPLFRLGKPAPCEGIESLPRKSDLEKGQAPMHKRIAGEKWCVAGTTPGGVYRLRQDSKGQGTLHGGDWCDLLVLDEASQMSLPEAMMAALTLTQNGQIIVVGDDRQMAPVVKHDWKFEPRRTFSAFKSYDSLFTTMRAIEPPIIKFEESFRLHRDIAEFLRQEIYAQDGINYRSQITKTLSTQSYEKLPPDDPFLRAVLNPSHPMIVVVHEEKNSMLHNDFECALLDPLLRVLSEAETFALDAQSGFGVVVPHRAQKARLRERVGKLNVKNKNGDDCEPPVDTVERFQGDERSAIAVSATESDPAYLLEAGRFLMDPRRLNVALSRAKNKMILVASRAVFDLFSADEEVFKNSQLWKNLLRKTCTEKLHEGELDGVRFTVYGNKSDADREL